MIMTIYCEGRLWVRIAKTKLHVGRAFLVALAIIGVILTPYVSFISNSSASALEPWQESGWSQIGVGNSHTCGVTTTGKVYCWGYGTSGELGNGVAANSSHPVAITTSGVLAGKTIAAVASGVSYSCAVSTEGKAYCWGTNTLGQLGNGTTQDSLVPVPVDITGALAGKTITSISAGSVSACAIASDHKAYCWGMGIYGQLGDGTGTNSLVPLAVETTGELAGKSVVTISVGDKHTCATTTEGNAYCWGSDSAGQLGTDLGGSSQVPLPVDTSGVLAGKTVLKISAGIAQTCAIASDGKAYCWGINTKGQLGDGTTQNKSLPVATDGTGVLAGKTLTSISTGSAWTCAASTDGLAYCWGENSVGQLGNGTLQDSLAPIAVDMTSGLSGKTVSTVSTSSFGHACAIASGQAYCWGKNDGGKLGNGSTAYATQALSPVPVLPLVTASISSHEFDEVDGRKVLQLTGIEFPPYLESLGRSLVTLNGAALPFCADGTGATAQQLVDFNHVNPAHVSDTPACYYIFSGGQAAMSPTNVNIWLPDSFDIAAAGSVAVDDSETYSFNTPAAADDEREAPVAPPVVSDTPVVAATIVTDKKPIFASVATVSAATDSTINTTTPQFELLVDTKDVTSTPTISSLPVFRGTAEPYSTVVVTVHSDPVTCTTKADAQGNWECRLTTSLPAGNHTVKIAMTTPDDRTTEIGPYSVQVAKTVIDESDSPSNATTDNSSNGGVGLPFWPMIGGLIVLVGVITAIIAAVRRRRRG
jgi:alpha-tubulin suppressor-like RCC1 family protein